MMAGDVQDDGANLLELGRVCSLGAGMPQPDCGLPDGGCKGRAGLADLAQRIPHASQHLQATQSNT